MSDSAGGADNRVAALPAETLRYFKTPRGIAALWFGLLGGPAAWYLHLMVSYSLVRLICESGDMWLLHLTTFATLVPALAGVSVAWRSWRRMGQPNVTTGGGTLGRSRFMALGGIAVSGFFTIILLMAWIPDFVIEPCVW